MFARLPLPFVALADRVKQVASGATIAALLVFAAYSIFAVVRAAYLRIDDGPLFWTTLVLIVLFALAALWLASRLYRKVLR
jgi:ABC-type bacteriocin/lantibiotic exporter with double-glycine peptidase domain